MIPDSLSICAHSGACGGCDFFEDYSSQLEYKDTYCRNLFARFRPAEQHAIIPSPEVNFFRNKTELVVGARGGAIAAGMREKGRFDRIISLTSCRNFHEKLGEILEEFTRWMRDEQLTSYDPGTREGLVRYLVLRHSKTTGKLLAVPVFTAPVDGESSLAGKLAAGLSRHAALASLHICHNDGRSDCALSDSIDHVWGERFIPETVGGVSYRIAPRTFFQVNTACCEKLYETIRRAVPAGERILDLYCGSGGIALQIASCAGEAIGVDTIGDNIEAARLNASDNGIRNIRFEKEDVRVFLAKHADTVSCAIIDPPRAGLHPRVVELLASSGIPLLVYVSCNPMKLREELMKLCVPYVLETVTPVDMFPHTRHIEVVAVLKLKGSV